MKFLILCVLVAFTSTSLGCASFVKKEDASVSIQEVKDEAFVEQMVYTHLAPVYWNNLRLVIDWLALDKINDHRYDGKIALRAMDGRLETFDVTVTRDDAGWNMAVKK